jgi:NADH:ubiquinone oxidoreductase subunit H
VIIAIVVLCGALIAVLTLHAMVIGNQQRLDDILKVAWKVLIGFGLWATVAHQWHKVKSIVQKAAIHVLRE